MQRQTVVLIVCFHWIHSCLYDKCFFPFLYFNFLSDLSIKKFFDTHFAELNGLQGKDQFEPMTSVMSRFAAEFSKPFGFTYEQGVVSHLTAPPGVSNTVINLCRGTLDLFAFKVKSDWAFYELQEARHHVQVVANPVKMSSKTLLMTLSGKHLRHMQE